METTTCNLCGSTSANALYQLTDLLLERDDVSAQLVKCSQCGLIYQNPRPTLAEMAQHYPPEYESYATPARDKPSWLVRKAIEYGVAKRCRTVTRKKNGGRLLDVGCASGTFLHGMQRYPQWALYGVEPSEHAAGIAQKAYGLNVRVGTLEAASFPDAYFDVVTLWDVLEHLHDPFNGLREIHRILKPQGLLVLRVPNADSVDARRFGPAWAGLDAPRHLYVFATDTLTRLVDKAGFQTKEVNCQIGSYPTFALSVRFWMKTNGIPLHRRQRISRLLYTPLARIVSVPVFWLYNLSLRGPLMVLTAEKRSTPSC
ncbi:MAG: class I SAM-dependent methyltransferase [Chloroflexota bacterium]